MLRNSEAVSNLLTEWRSVDFDNVARQAALNQQMGEPAYELISECKLVNYRSTSIHILLYRLYNLPPYIIVAHELEQLFVKQSSLEVYFEWLDSIIERRVSEVCSPNPLQMMYTDSAMHKTRAVRKCGKYVGSSKLKSYMLQTV